MPSLATILRTLREERNLTQEQLARLADLTTTAVTKVEQGRVTDPSWSTVCKLADALGVPVTAFRNEVSAEEAPAPEKPRRRGRPVKVKKGGAR